MDYRVPLKLHTVLDFEGMSCHVEEVIGQGSNAIVYKGWYRDGLNRELCHHVLVKELFPFHARKKIWRRENGHIAVEHEAEEIWRTHKESFEIGNEVHLRLLEDHPEYLGANLNSFHYNGTLYSVLGYTGGYVVETMETVLWALMNTDNYRDCVLTCVNMGYDADSTAAIAGGLAGLYYGYDSIPEEWVGGLVNKELIEACIKGMEEYVNGL